MGSYRGSVGTEGDGRGKEGDGSYREREGKKGEEVLGRERRGKGGTRNPYVSADSVTLCV
jgi:hypothetical protein